MNYFDNRSTNASAESFNAKIKAFRSKFRGVRNIELSFLEQPICLLNLSIPQVFNLIPIFQLKISTAEK
ncbi:transposase [Flavobacterium columnare]|uniref:transposase n=1 Tax=Flavobacterium columnare TaxID=996 RepID=UPI0021C8C2BA|nr:transposase [Flavobacterium columnare]